MKTSTILTAIFAISIWACNPAGNASNEDSIVTGNNTGTLNEPTVSDTSSTNSDLAYLLDYNSRYPHEVNLWMNEILQKRLDLIIGKESLDMIKQWTTEVPIEVSDGFVKISVCQPYDCDDHNYLLMADARADILAVGIKTGTIKKIYVEKGASIPRALTEWDADK